VRFLIWKKRMKFVKIGNWWNDFGEFNPLSYGHLPCKGRQKMPSFTMKVASEA
jgi:hypothetical protein